MAVSERHRAMFEDWGEALVRPRVQRSLFFADDMAAAIEWLAELAGAKSLVERTRQAETAREEAHKFTQLMRMQRINTAIVILTLAATVLGVITSIILWYFPGR